MIRKEAAVRAFTPEPDRKPHRNVPWYLPRQILVLDTETWIDPAQAFRFGFFRYARLRWGRSGRPAISVVEESIVHADDPSPSELRVLQRYRRTHRASVDHSVLGAQYRIALYSRTDFEKTVVSRAFRSNTTWVIGANLPFDLSRLVAPHLQVSSTGFEAGPGYKVDPKTKKRTRREQPGFYTGGFSLPFSEYKDERGWHERSKDEPRLALKRLGPQRTAMGLIWSLGAPRREFHGHFLDVLTLAAALSGEHLPLTAEPPGKGFCELFGVDYPRWLERFGVPFGKREAPHGNRLTPGYISYNRADVAATSELFGALMAEHRALGIKTQPTRIFSSASVSKDTLRRLGVPARLDVEPGFPEKVLGYSMVAFYGGRSECKIRRIPVPVTYLDVKSMYPAVSKLLGLQEPMAANRVVARDSEAEPGLLEQAQRFLEGLTLEDVLEKDTWKELRGIALVEPNGDLLPIRADWQSEALGIAQCYVDAAREPSWWALPDLAASRIRVPHAPVLKRVILLHAEKPAPSLRPISLAGRRLDLRKHNLYSSLIETREAKGKEDERWDRFLKVVANSLYGITAEMNPERTVDGKEAQVAVHALRSFDSPTKLPEGPGRFFFAPVAALTTAGARLLLAVLERLVTDAESTWCFADTDSMAVVSSRRGGLVACPGGSHLMSDGREAVKALSWNEVDQIRARISTLNPFERSVIPDLLKIEKVNHERNDPKKPRRELWAWAISAKRYMLFVPTKRGRPHIIETAEARELEDVEPEEIAEHRLHGLGHLMNPKNPDSTESTWTKEAWAWMYGADLDPGAVPPSPAWFELPALSKYTVSTPNLLRAFQAHNAGLPYSQAIKPFNFLLVAHLSEDERRRRGVDFRLAAPYTRNIAEWPGLPWRNTRAPSKRSGTVYAITTKEELPEDLSVVQVKSYGDVVREYLDHAEAKAVEVSGNPCRGETRGVLFPPRLRVTSWHAIGKETNELEGRTVGLLDTHEATNAYRDPSDDADARILDAMNKLGMERLWNETVRISERYDAPPGTMPIARNTIRDILTRRTGGTATHRRMLREAARRGMRRWLRGMDRIPERGTLAALVDQFLGAWDELVEGPSQQYEKVVRKLDDMPRGSVATVAARARVSRQKLRKLTNPEQRAEVVRVILDASIS